MFIFLSDVFQTIFERLSIYTGPINFVLSQESPMAQQLLVFQIYFLCSTASVSNVEGVFIVQMGIPTPISRFFSTPFKSDLQSKCRPFWLVQSPQLPLQEYHSFQFRGGSWVATVSEEYSVPLEHHNSRHSSEEARAMKLVPSWFNVQV